MMKALSALQCSLHAGACAYRYWVNFSGWTSTGKSIVQSTAVTHWTNCWHVGMLARWHVEAKLNIASQHQQNLRQAKDAGTKPRRVQGAYRPAGPQLAPVLASEMETYLSFLTKSMAIVVQLPGLLACQASMLVHAVQPCP